MKRNALRRGIQKLFNILGFEIRRKMTWSVYSWLVNAEIKTVLDIGANNGQFALRIHRLLPDAHIASFEPLKSCFEELKRTMSFVPDFSCYNFALGDKNENHIIYHNQFTPSSSMLPMEELHREAFPITGNATEEIIEVRRLDDVANLLKLTEDILIKIDVQGFESKVIRGGEKTIKRAKIVIVETSFEPLYRGQLLFDDIYLMLRSLGFVFKGCEEPLRHPKDGRILQCDSIFIQEDEVFIS